MVYDLVLTCLSTSLLQYFQAEEHKAKKASEKVMERLERQMNKAKLESDVRAMTFSTY